jgi:hypothetical protein
MFLDDVNGRTVLRQLRAREEVAQALSRVEFPITKQELIVKLGDARLFYDRETVGPLAEIVRGVAASRFSNAGEAQRMVDQRLARVMKSLAAVERAEERRG